MNPTDANFLSDAIGRLLSNAGGLLIGVLLLIVIIVAISMSGCSFRKDGSGPDGDGHSL